MNDKNPKLRTPLPESVGIHKRNVTILVGLILLFFLSVIVFATSKTEIKDNKSKAFYGNIKPGELISSLPENYMAIETEKPKSFSNKEIYYDKGQKGEDLEAKLLEQERLRRIKRAIEARESELSFKGVKKTSESLNYNDKEYQDLNFRQSSTTLQNERDTDNRQDDKYEFLTRNRSDETELSERIKVSSSPYQLKAGSVIMGLILTGINSDLPGQILGQVSRNIYDSVSGKYLLIPKGTRVLGEYDSRVSFGQERVLVIWSRLLFPNGDSISLGSMGGTDLAGLSGLKDKVNNHYDKLITGVVFGSVFGAGAQMARGGNRTVDPTFSQLALEGSAQNINQAGQTITRKNLNIQPTLEIRAGERFNIFVNKDVFLRPYKE